MNEIYRLARRAHEIGRQDGLNELGKVTFRYLRKKTPQWASLPYWRGQLKRQLVLSCDGTQVVFDTKSRAAKRWFYPQRLDGRLHEPAFTSRLLDTLAEESVFYDVGANVGYFTLFASEICTEGSVHSFELDEKFVQAIEASLQKNGSDAEVVRKAISDISGEKVKYTDSAIPEIDNRSGVGPKTVTTISIDDYTKSNPTPTVMKIDVEGFEYQVLEGAHDTLRRPEMNTLFLECHPDLLGQYGAEVSDVFSLLDDLGFDCRAIDNHRESGVPVLRDICPDEVDDNVMLEFRK